jgi:hypothetical protein
MSVRHPDTHGRVVASAEIGSNQKDAPSCGERLSALDIELTPTRREA